MLTKRRTLLAAAGTLAAGLSLRKLRAQDGTQEAPPPRTLLGLSGMIPATPPAPPPAFGFRTADGQARTLADYAGKGVVLNLWATWCMPCVAELPDLAAMAAKLADQGVVVLPLSSDHGGAAAVEAFFARHDIKGLPVLLDPDGAAARTLGARGIPTTLVIDWQGREQGRVEGAVHWAAEETETRLLKLVG